MSPAPAGASSDVDMALSKTFFSSLPPPPPGPASPPKSSSPGVDAAPAKPTSPPSPAAAGRARTLFGVPAKPSPSTPLRLPTEEEARDNPHLVISLDPQATPPAPSTPVWNPSNASPPPPRAETGEAPPLSVTPVVERNLTPIDLPKIGSQAPLPLPMPEGEAEAEAPFFERVGRAARSVYELLTWSVELYLRLPARFFLIVAMVVLPASFLNSCVRVGVTTFAAPSLHIGATKVDFSARKAELAERIARSQAAGEIDKRAAAELAALTAAEAPTVVAEAGLPASVPGWLAQILISLVAGLLIAGLAYPMAAGALAVVAADRQAGTRLLGPGELLSLLSRRMSLLLPALLPAALLISLGYLLLVVPGIILSIALAFVAHVVVFERKSGMAALRRSANLVKADLLRVILLCLTFVLAGFLIGAFMGLFAGATDSRALAFVRSIIGDVLVMAFFPVPGLALARLYLDLRKHEGMSPGAIARSAR